MNTPIILGVLAVLAVWILPVVAFAAYDAWLMRQLPPQLRLLARHADGVCNRRTCPYPHNPWGEPQ